MGRVVVCVSVLCVYVSVCVHVYVHALCVFPCSQLHLYTFVYVFMKALSLLNLYLHIRVYAGFVCSTLASTHTFTLLCLEVCAYGLHRTLHV